MLASIFRRSVRGRRGRRRRSRVGWARPVIELTALSAGGGHHRSYVRRIGTSLWSFPDFSVGAVETLPRNNLPEFKTMLRSVIVGVVSRLGLVVLYIVGVGVLLVEV